ncbi:MAG: hypothetical protein KDA60_02530 [Planctomycetales bacterium]|nr:hypothetical protein [Planctomycetales bacterium]
MQVREQEGDIHGFGSLAFPGTGRAEKIECDPVAGGRAAFSPERAADQGELAIVAELVPYL